MASWTKARPRARTWANVTWIKLQVSKVPQTRFCWLCRVCPPIFKSKTPKPGKPVPWKRPTENANAKSPKMSSQSNFLQPYNMREWTFSRSSALFQSQQIMAWTFSFFAAGAFPGKTFPPLGSQLANCSPGKPGQQVVLPFVKLAKSSPSWNHALITKGTYYTYKSINKLNWKLYQKSNFFLRSLDISRILSPKKNAANLRRVLFPWLNLGPWTSHLSGFRPSYGCPKWSPLQVLSISKEPVLCGFLSLISTQWQKSP